jgi:soluble lytic murein transglycosylase-like protein
LFRAKTITFYFNTSICESALFRRHDITFRESPNGRSVAGFSHDKACAVRAQKRSHAMRYSISIGRLIRFGILMVTAAALQTLVIAAPALARSHAHAHRFISRRHVLMTMQGSEFAPGSPSFFAPFAAQQGTQRQNALASNDWRRNARYARQGEQSAFGQNYWQRSGSAQYSPLDGMVAEQASAAGVPVSLVERVIKRESGGNQRAVSRGNYGLMQIRLGTARAMGYSGSASGLLDAQTNMTYAVRYLAGAYRAAGGNENRAVALYARGYYDVAKAQGFTPYGLPYGFSSVSRNAGFYQPVAFQTEEPAGGMGTRRVWPHRHHPV